MAIVQEPGAQLTQASQTSPTPPRTPTAPVSSSLIVDALRYRWWLVLVVMLITAAVAVLISRAQDDKYDATASLLFTTVPSALTAPNTDRDRQAATNTELVSSSPVYDQAARRLGLTRSELEDMIDILPQGNSDVIAIRASAGRPEQAQSVANTFANTYVAFRRRADEDQVAQAQARVQRLLSELTPSERKGARGRALRLQASNLQSIAPLQTGGVEVLSPAVRPTAASSPKTTRAGILGLVLGCLLGLGIAIGLERLDKKLRHREDAEAIFGAPVLAEVPRFRGSGRGLRPKARGRFPADAFARLWSSLRYYDGQPDETRTSILVVSAGSGENRSAASFYLALTAARSHRRVLIIDPDVPDADLDPRSPGLGAVLTGDAALSDAATPIDREYGCPAGTLSVLRRTGPTESSGAVLDASPMRRLLLAAPLQYDVIVVDAPPLLTGADAIPLVGAVSGVIVVSRLGKTTTPQAAALARELHHLDARVFGVVLTGAGRSRGLRRLT